MTLPCKRKALNLSKKGKTKFDDNEFDTVLLLTVLHHSENPLQAVKEAVRVAKPGGRLIVIESVYGIKKHSCKKFKCFFGLGAKQQKRIIGFFDHFTNRVIYYYSKKQKASVPLNFYTIPEWKKIFEKNYLEIEKILELGFDQPSVPEYHALFVLRAESKGF